MAANVSGDDAEGSPSGVFHSFFKGTFDLDAIDGKAVGEGDEFADLVVKVVELHLDLRGVELAEGVEAGGRFGADTIGRLEEPEQGAFEQAQLIGLHFVVGGQLA